MSARKAKPKMGRPPLPKGEAKASLFCVRVSRSEREAIERIAEKEGVSASEWARRVLTNEAEKMS